MTLIGKVSETNNGIAVVTVSRPVTCGENCAMCKGCNSSSKQTSAINLIGAKAGDMVKIEMKDSNVLLAAFVVYILPLIIAFTAFIIAYSQMQNYMNSVLIGGAFFIVSFCLIFAFDKKLQKTAKFHSKIVKILSD